MLKDSRGRKNFPLNPRFQPLGNTHTIVLGSFNLLINGLLINGLPWWLSGKESACQSGDTGSIPGSVRPPGVGTGNPLQYSWLENPTDGGGWQATVCEVKKSWTGLSH